MKIQLQLSEARTGAIKKELEALGIEITPDAELILSEKNSFADILYGKEDGFFRVIPVSEIDWIESFGHDIRIHSAGLSFGSDQPLCKLQASLDPEKFMRISNSAIIAKSAVRKIRVSFSRKFTLVTKRGDTVDVTKSYYYKFKEWMGL